MNIIEKFNGNFVFTSTGEIISPKFKGYTIIEDYENDNVKPICPMTAKESLNEDELEKMLESEDYIAEEKLDGTRQLLHIDENGSRLFSRNLSKDTGWYVENTDSLPHLRELTLKSKLTILDGEMRIDGKEFKEVSSTLNCTWDKAIDRQIELGFITMHVFDIIYYKGIYIAKMPLWKRKEYVAKAVKEINSPFIKEENFTTNTIKKIVGGKDNVITKLVQYDHMEGLKELYPNLHEAIVTQRKYMSLIDLIQGLEIELNKRAWYEFIIANGGEGLMLKPLDGQYLHKRGREYTKWKKYITRDCIIMGFSEPTKLYDGKFTNDSWEYWITSKGNNKCTLDYKNRSAESILADKDINGVCNFIPVSKFYYNNWVGNMRFGVVATETEIGRLMHLKLNPVYEEINGMLVLEVGECAGFNEEVREDFTKNKELYVGEVVEVLANEIFKKSGKLRHPRYMRMRKGDKNAEQCTWKDHIEG